MSGLTKAYLKELVKSGRVIEILLANEVLTSRELADEARKDYRRAAEEQTQLANQLEIAVETLKKGSEQLAEGFDSENLSYDTQSVNWVHKHIDQTILAIKEEEDE